MNSLGDCSFKEKNLEEGISLLETMIVVAILALLVGSFLPPSIDFYNSREFDSHVRAIVQSLRKAQSGAMAGDSDSPFGVYFETERYTVFKGSSYSERTPEDDEIFELPPDASFAGITEVVFSKFKGLPSDTGDINLTIGNRSAVININEVGMIDYFFYR